jgi:hypothetical protein
MSYSPTLLLHIVSGTLGMLSGFVAVFLRKGSRQHTLAGKVFVASMLSLSAIGVYLALMKSQPGNVLGGTLTFYLVITAWMTTRRKNGPPRTFDWVALVIVLAVAGVNLTYGLEAAMSPTELEHEYPSGPYFFLGSVAVLAAVGDVRMLVRGGISGTRVWRGTFGACASLYSSPRLPYSWRGNKYFPRYYKRPACFFC